MLQIKEFHTAQYHGNPPRTHSRPYVPLSNLDNASRATVTRYFATWGEFGAKNIPYAMLSDPEHDIDPSMADEYASALSLALSSGTLESYVRNLPKPIGVSPRTHDRRGDQRIHLPKGVSFDGRIHHVGMLVPYQMGPYRCLFDSIAMLCVAPGGTMLKRTGPGLHNVVRVNEPWVCGVSIAMVEGFAEACARAMARTVLESIQAGYVFEVVPNVPLVQSSKLWIGEQQGWVRFAENLKAFSERTELGVHSIAAKLHRFLEEDRVRNSP